MAPTTKPKKPLKSMEKLVDKPNMKKKIKKKNFDTYAMYLYRVLRSINNEMGISRQAMLIMNNFVVDMMENIASEASRLIAHSKKTTMGSQDIQAAIKLSIPGELAKHAHAESVKAIARYKRSQEMANADD